MRGYRPKLLENDSGGSSHEYDTRTEGSVMGTGGPIDTKGVWLVDPALDDIRTREALADVRKRRRDVDN